MKQYRKAADFSVIDIPTVYAAASYSADTYRSFALVFSAAWSPD